MPEEISPRFGGFLWVPQYNWCIPTWLFFGHGNMSGRAGAKAKRPSPREECRHLGFGNSGPNWRRSRCETQPTKAGDQQIRQLGVLFASTNQTVLSLR